MGEDRQHLRLAEHRHQDGEDRQLVIAELARRDRDGFIPVGGASPSNRDENSLEHEVSEIEDAHHDIDGDERRDRRERQTDHHESQ